MGVTETQDPDVVHVSFIPEPGAKTEEHDVSTNGSRMHVGNSITGKAFAVIAEVFRENPEPTDVPRSQWPRVGRRRTAPVQRRAASILSVTRDYSVTPDDSVSRDVSVTPGYSYTRPADTPEYPVVYLRFPQLHRDKHLRDSYIIEIPTDGTLVCVTADKKNESIKVWVRR